MACDRLMLIEPGDFLKFNTRCTFRVNSDVALKFSTEVVIDAGSVLLCIDKRVTADFLEYILLHNNTKILLKTTTHNFLNAVKKDFIAIIPNP